MTASKLCYGTNNGLTKGRGLRSGFENCTIFIGNLEATFLSEKDYNLFQVF